MQLITDYCVELPLLYAVGPYQLQCVYVSPSLPVYPLLPGRHRLVFCICDSVFVLQIHLYPIFEILFLTSRSTVVSGSIHAAQMASLRSVAAEQCSIVCGHRIFTRSSADGRLGCFHVMAVVNSVQWTLGCTDVSFQIIFFYRCMLRSAIAVSYGSSVLSFLRTRHTVPYSGCNQFMFPPTVQEDSLMSTCSTAFLT